MLPLRAQSRPPNIIFILADDLGWGDLGCYGQEQVRTPNLDRLAAQGMRFTHAYAGGAVCAPSRSCLHTGLHNGHTRVRGNGNKIPLRPEDTTTAEVLKKAGYRTGLFGKWSLGGIYSTGYPTRKGYDEWFGYFSQTHAHNYYPELLLDGEREVILRGNTGASKKDYTHDLFTERALKFIEKHRSGPFFLDLAYTIPHTNNELARDTGNGMEVPNDAPYSDRKWPRIEKNFAAMVTRLDASVGRISELVERLGIAENTLLVFASDNGPHHAGGHDANFFRSAGHLRGYKGDLYEGGVRVPAIAAWKGRIRAGHVNDTPWAFCDVLPTFADLAGVAEPRGLDGVSIKPLLLRGAAPSREYLYWEHHERRGFSQSIRAGDWKGVRQGQRGPLELYDLKSDPSEKRNLAATKPEVVTKLEKLLAGARTESADFPVRSAPPA